MKAKEERVVEEGEWFVGRCIHCHKEIYSTEFDGETLICNICKNWEDKENGR